MIYNIRVGKTCPDRKMYSRKRRFLMNYRNKDWRNSMRLTVDYN